MWTMLSANFVIARILRFVIVDWGIEYSVTSTVNHSHCEPDTFSLNERLDIPELVRESNIP